MKNQTIGVSDTWDKVVKVAMLIFISVGAIIGYAQYIDDDRVWVARGAVAFVVILCLERLTRRKV